MPGQSPTAAPDVCSVFARGFSPVFAWCLLRGFLCWSIGPWEKPLTVQGHEEGMRVGSSSRLAAALARQVLRALWGYSGDGDAAEGLFRVFQNDPMLQDLIWIPAPRMGWSHPAGREALSAEGLEWSSIACS